MKLRKILAIAIVAVTASAMLAGCGGTGGGDSDSKGSDGETITLKFASVSGTNAKDASYKFEELVEQYSNGTIQVDIFPDNQLGADAAVVESVQLGDVDLACSSTSALVSIYPDYYLFDAPYLFLNREQATQVGLKSATAVKIMEGVSEIRLKGVSLWENGFRNLTNSKREVSKVDDLDGMKIRTMENDVHLAAWTAFGANPTPMAFTELYTAMQQKTVDGQENPLVTIESNGFYEVNPYITLTEHVYTPYCIVMNPDSYEKMSDAQKEAFDKAMAEATDYELELSEKYETEAKQTLIEQGATVTELSTEAKAEFQKKVMEADVWEMVKKKMTHPEYFDEMEADLK